MTGDNKERPGSDNKKPHAHKGGTPDVNEAGHYELMAQAMKELLIEKRVISAEDVRRNLEFLDSRTPADGARIVARAWTDAAFKERLLENGTAAVAEMGFTMADTELIVVENTEDVHNVIVCTLCSCYPRTILGLPPDWYKSKSYRARVVSEPRAVLREFGTVLPEGKVVRIHDSNADMRYIVLPERPAGTEGWSAEQLAELVTRDALVGVSVPVIDATRGGLG